MTIMRRVEKLKEVLPQSWLTFCIGFLILSVSDGVDFKGAEVNFVKYASWEPCQNGTLTFEFKTHQMNALLLYIDGRPSKDFLEIKLVGGAVVLRLNLGNGALMLNVGSGLNDMSWHRVQVIRNDDQTSLIVDKTSQTLSSKGSEHTFGGKGDKFVYMGGIPPEYNEKMGELALPSVLFEPRLHGSVRNVLYRNCGGPPERPDMLDFEGIRSSQSDQCERKNPCKNNGICLSTDKDAICDCSGTEFDGMLCGSRKTPSDATFFGNEYLSYDMSGRGDPIVSNKDIISLNFKTQHSNGLLFYTGQDSDYIAIVLHNSNVAISVNLGSGEFKREINKNVNDNQWHHLKVTREARETVIMLDGVIRLTESTSGDFTLLSSSIMYVGGHPINENLHGFAVNENFKGCLRKVQYIADSINLDIIELAKSSHDFIRMNGNIMFNQCKDITQPQPITFLEPESFISIQCWQAIRNASISFKFRTTEKMGLILYNGDASKQSDYVAVEIMDGHLYFIMEMGAGVIKKKKVPTATLR